jgi:alkylated DNA repair dioxygenase AlkB
MSRRQRLLADQMELFVPERPLPEGFAYQDGVISAAEEQVLLDRFQELPFKPFEFHGFFGNRRIVSFGWRYDFAGRRLRESEAIPAFLFPLREQAAAFAGASAEGLQQILINEYAAGAGIGWHRDKAMFEDVIAVSLASPCTLRLRRKDGAGWERASQTLQPRSAYLLRGPSRRVWEHSVPPVDHLRYSVTFRNFAAGSGG